MIAPDALTEALAAVLCDAWFGIAELPTRWPSADMAQRDTFRAMATSALKAAREGRKSDDQVAEALCHAFWAGAPLPRPWSAHLPQQREVFKICARAMIAAARERRSSRPAAHPAPQRQARQEEAA